MYERYCKIRDSKGFTDAQIAGACGFSQSTLSDWKKRRSTPKIEKLAKIADCLGISLHYLVNGREAASTAFVPEILTLYNPLDLGDQSLALGIVRQMAARDKYKYKKRIISRVGNVIHVKWT